MEKKLGMRLAEALNGERIEVSRALVIGKVLEARGVMSVVEESSALLTAWLGDATSVSAEDIS